VPEILKKARFFVIAGLNSILEGLPKVDRVAFF